MVSPVESSHVKPHRIGQARWLSVACGSVCFGVERDFLSCQSVWLEREFRHPRKQPGASPAKEAHVRRGGQAGEHTGMEERASNHEPSVPTATFPPPTRPAATPTRPTTPHPPNNPPNPARSAHVYSRSSGRSSSSPLSAAIVTCMHAYIIGVNGVHPRRACKPCMQAEHASRACMSSMQGEHARRPSIACVQGVHAGICISTSSKIGWQTARPTAKFISPMHCGHVAYGDLVSCQGGQGAGTNEPSCPQACIHIHMMHVHAVPSGVHTYTHARARAYACTSIARQRSRSSASPVCISSSLIMP